MGNNFLLIINPGSTTTKLACFVNDEQILSEEIEHRSEVLDKFTTIFDQLDYRLSLIEEKLTDNNVDNSKFTAIVARGGNMKPVSGGTYEINEEMLSDLKIGVMGQHASNLGAHLAKKLAEKLDIPCFVVDPVVVDELAPVARYSGTPLIQRKSKDHPLNQKAVGRIDAHNEGGTYEEMNYIIAHMGGGISVAAHNHGEIIDVNNALNGDGPFSPERAGGLPVTSVIDLCFSGDYSENELRAVLVGNGGLKAYLGTTDGREVSKLINEGDSHAKEVYQAMAYQISKEIGAMATVLKGQINGILLTGGLAFDDLLIGYISEYCNFLADIRIYPGENEMVALAAGVNRVMNNEEKLKKYSQ
ncbi:butyrate kinase [Vagococcus sp. PNs007]|uniref:Probable butyrate kinase n=1 Tax=Vagococcus proximus TaxID=2991417 RepID=A0ABT5X368_9ENTE|nr:butyrate kinase [Vagococcus proximus]MDF0480449.1 butyrate kinase [Vagococcus proximus]